MRTMVVLTLLLCASAARASEAPIDLDPAAIDTHVGHPADPGRAHAVLAAAREEGTESLVSALRAVALCGGVGAADAVLPYLRHPEPAVRAAALRGLGRVGLRRRSYATAVRRVVRWSKEEDLPAAVRALGHLGDASDFEELLRLLGDKDAATSAAAHYALGSLTGKRLPRSGLRWSYWMRTVAPARSRDLRATLAALKSEARAVHAAERRMLLGPEALLDRERVERAIGKWLRSDADDRILLACEVARAHGLLDVLEDLETAASFRARSAPVRAAAQAVLRAFGLAREEPK